MRPVDTPTDRVGAATRCHSDEQDQDEQGTDIYEPILQFRHSSGDESFRTKYQTPAQLDSTTGIAIQSGGSSEHDTLSGATGAELLDGAAGPIFPHGPVPTDAMDDRLDGIDWSLPKVESSGQQGSAHDAGEPESASLGRLSMLGDDQARLPGSGQALDRSLKGRPSAGSLVLDEVFVHEATPPQTLRLSLDDLAALDEAGRRAWETQDEIAVCRARSASRHDVGPRVADPLVGAIDDGSCGTLFNGTGALLPSANVNPTATYNALMSDTPDSTAGKPVNEEGHRGYTNEASDSDCASDDDAPFIPRRHRRGGSHPSAGAADDPLPTPPLEQSRSHAKGNRPVGLGTPRKRGRTRGVVPSEVQIRDNNRERSKKGAPASRGPAATRPVPCFLTQSLDSSRSWLTIELAVEQFPCMPLCTRQAPGPPTPTPQGPRRRIVRTVPPHRLHCSAQRTRFSSEEDRRLIRLKEQRRPRLSWQSIAEHFPNRTVGSLQVRYCTRLRGQSAKDQ